MMLTGTLAAFVLVAQSGAVDASMQADGYGSLLDGRNAEAISQIETDVSLKRDDPARLINLGIAYARAGKEAKARQLFEAAVKSKNRAELETASGAWEDSRTLARQAIRMLDRGEFESNRLAAR